MSAVIINGEMPEALLAHEDDSFDACLSDPPYGLRFMGKRWDYDVPGVDTWRAVLRVLKPGAPLLAFGGTRTWHRLANAIEDAGFELRDQIAWVYAQGFPKSRTVLKPAFEPILVARKPLDGTVAENVARWGVGSLAIDACRVGQRAARRLRRGATTGKGLGYGSGSGPQDVIDGGRGRWPANVILHGDVANDIEARGTRVSGFFFCPKASRREREAGLDDLPLVDVHRYGAGLGEGHDPRAPARNRNHHPTVKPVALTTYLARLVMPEKPGALLVPFAGSGSEMIGALRAGWRNVVGIEREQAYVAIATSRIAAEAA